MPAWTETNVTAAVGPAAPGRVDPEWWRSAVVYQIYPRSFADSDGDGIGDLPGVLAHLDYIADAGHRCRLALPGVPVAAGGQRLRHQRLPRRRSVLRNAGRSRRGAYAAVHDRGMRLIMDLVVNHTSDQHPWFVESRSVARHRQGGLVLLARCPARHRPG